MRRLACKLFVECFQGGFRVWPLAHDGVAGHDVSQVARVGPVSQLDEPGLKAHARAGDMSGCSGLCLEKIDIRLHHGANLFLGVKAVLHTPPDVLSDNGVNGVARLDDGAFEG